VVRVAQPHAALCAARCRAVSPISVCAQCVRIRALRTLSTAAPEGPALRRAALLPVLGLARRGRGQQGAVPCRLHCGPGR
jgi:hypothetical protein